MSEDANPHLNLILHGWSTFLADFAFSRGNVPWSICFILMWQRSGVLGGLAVITCTQTARHQVWSPAGAQNFFRSQIVTYLTQCYIWWPMWSLSSKCMRACFLFGCVNVMVVRCLLWSSSYDAHPDSNRPAFDHLLRHNIFWDCYLLLIWPTVTFITNTVPVYTQILTNFSRTMSNGSYFLVPWGPRFCVEGLLGLELDLVWWCLPYPRSILWSKVSFCWFKAVIFALTTTIFTSGLELINYPVRIVDELVVYSWHYFDLVLV